MALPPDLVNVLTTALPTTYYEQYPALLSAKIVKMRLALTQYQLSDIIPIDELTPAEHISYAFTLTGLVGYQAQLFLPAKIALTVAIMNDCTDQNLLADLLQRADSTGVDNAVLAAFHKGNLFAALWLHLQGHILVLLPDFLILYMRNVETPAQSYFAQPFTDNFLRGVLGACVLPVNTKSISYRKFLDLVKAYHQMPGVFSNFGNFLRYFLLPGSLTATELSTGLIDNNIEHFLICNITTTLVVGIYKILGALAYHQLECYNDGSEFPHISTERELFLPFSVAQFQARARPMRELVLAKFSPSSSREYYLRQLDFMLNPTIEKIDDIDKLLLVIFDRIEGLTEAVELEPYDLLGSHLIACPALPKLLQLKKNEINTHDEILDAISYAALNNVLVACQFLLQKYYDEVDVIHEKEDSDDEEEARDNITTLPGLRHALSSEVKKFKCANGFLLQYAQLPLAEIQHQYKSPQPDRFRPGLTLVNGLTVVNSLSQEQAQKALELSYELGQQDSLAFQVPYACEYHYATKSYRELCLTITHSIPNMYEAETWYAQELEVDGAEHWVIPKAPEIAVRQAMAIFLAAQ